MPKTSSRLTELDKKVIIDELNKWAQGELGSKLTWEMLEKRFGFTRQALKGHRNIYTGYRTAKKALSGGLVETKNKVSKDNEELLIEIERLNLELKVYKDKEKSWKKRWQRIAFHIRNKGMQVASIDKEIPGSTRAPSDTETGKILKMFDKDIPPSGRV